MIDRIYAVGPKKAVRCKASVASSMVEEAAATATEKTAATKRVVKKKETAPAKPIRDGQQHIKTRLLSELELITDAMLKGAKKGGTAPLRLLWELGKLDQDPTARPKKREVSLSALLTQEIRRKAAEEKKSKAAEQGPAK